MAIATCEKRKPARQQRPGLTLSSDGSPPLDGRTSAIDNRQDRAENRIFGPPRNRGDVSGEGCVCSSND